MRKTNLYILKYGEGSTYPAHSSEELKSGNVVRCFVFYNTSLKPGDTLLVKNPIKDFKIRVENLVFVSKKNSKVTCWDLIYTVLDKVLPPQSFVEGNITWI